MTNTVNKIVHIASRAETMAAFDALPKSVRQALSEAAVNWSPQMILRDLRAGSFTIKGMVEAIRKMDAAMVKRYATARKAAVTRAINKQKELNK